MNNMIITGTEFTEEDAHRVASWLLRYFNHKSASGDVPNALFVEVRDALSKFDAWCTGVSPSSVRAEEAALLAADEYASAHARPPHLYEQLHFELSEVRRLASQRGALVSATLRALESRIDALEERAKHV